MAQEPSGHRADERCSLTSPVAVRLDASWGGPIEAVRYLAGVLQIEPRGLLGMGRLSDLAVRLTRVAAWAPTKSLFSR